MRRAEQKWPAFFQGCPAENSQLLTKRYVVIAIGGGGLAVAKSATRFG
jgi:hypothetical protein